MGDLGSTGLPLVGLDLSDPLATWRPGATAPRRTWEGRLWGVSGRQVFQEGRGGDSRCNDRLTRGGKFYKDQSDITDEGQRDKRTLQAQLLTVRRGETEKLRWMKAE